MTGTKWELVDRVRSHFGYLFDLYQYQAIACTRFDRLGNWIVVLESPSCGRILVMQDREEIILALGPQGPAESATGVPWFDLAVVLEYLSQGRDMVLPVPGDPNEQMAWFSDVLKPYMAQVANLFMTGAFEGARAEMDRIGARRERELRGGEHDGRHRSL